MRVEEVERDMGMRVTLGIVCVALVAACSSGALSEDADESVPLPPRRAEAPTDAADSSVERPIPTTQSADASVGEPSSSALPDAGADAAADAGPPPETVKIYGKYAASVGDRLYTPNPNEGQPAYALDGASYKFLKSAAADSRPVYRCRFIANSVHFVALEPQCGGQINEGVLGHAYKQAAGRSVIPLYLCNHATDNVLTPKDSDCRNNGFAVVGLLGYFPK